MVLVVGVVVPVFRNEPKTCTVLGKMFFIILATFAEFEVDLLRMRTRKGMAIAKGRGRLKGKQPELSPRQW